MMDVLKTTKVAFSSAMEVSELGKMNKMLGDFNPYVKTQPAGAAPQKEEENKGEMKTD
jgi:hypothetical protein